MTATSVIAAAGSGERLRAGGAKALRQFGRCDLLLAHDSTSTKVRNSILVRM